MIAVDTNILVYAHRAEPPFHTVAMACISRLASAPVPWAIPWPCVYEFLAVVTHPRIFVEPTPMGLALEQVEAWLASPGVLLLSEMDRQFPITKTVLLESHLRGPAVHDAKVAALCLAHGVDELWTADRDYGRFPALKTRNPLLPPFGA